MSSHVMQKSKNVGRRRARAGRRGTVVADGDSASRGSLAVRFALAPTIFGNVYRTILKTVYSSSLTGVTTVANTWKANSTHLIGPQANYTGSFGSAAPTGLYNLLSSSTAAGSTAPYNRYRVRRSMIRIFADQGNGATVAVVIAAFPSSNLSFNGTTISQFVEQPLCKRVAVPLDVDATRPILQMEVDAGAMLGVSQRSITDSPDWWGTAGGDPNLVQYWQVLFASTDGSTNMSLYVNTEVYHEVEFFSRNQLLPTAV